jgi:hypothetical protein
MQSKPNPWAIPLDIEDSKLVAVRVAGGNKEFLEQTKRRQDNEHDFQLMDQWVQEQVSKCWGKASKCKGESRGDEWGKDVSRA